MTNIEQQIHSGKFTDYEGEEVEVILYKRGVLDHLPSSLTFPASGGNKLMTVWCDIAPVTLTLGDIYDWLELTKIGEKPIEGSNQRVQVYKVTCRKNPDRQGRTASLVATVNTIEGGHYVEYIDITQKKNLFIL